MTALRIGVIGAGHLGRIHARLLGNVPSVTLAGVADPVSEARLKIAADCGVRAVADYRELIGEIDAAVVATPTRYHHAVGMALLAAGVHLLIEKPLASTVAQANELVAAARRAKVVLQVGHIERFNPALDQVRPLVREPKFIEAIRCSGYTGRSTDIGVVLDLMIHDLDVVLSLVHSPVRKVDALGMAVFGPHEDLANARLSFENGCVANLSVSRVSYRSLRQMQVWSREAFAGIDFATGKSTVVEPGPRVLRRDVNVDAMTVDERTQLRERLFEDYLAKREFEAGTRNALLDELVDFAESIRERRAPRVTGEQGRDVLSVAEAILHEIEHHAWDGHPSGPVGPRTKPPVPILRGPHWGTALPFPTVEHREAS